MRAKPLHGTACFRETDPRQGDSRFQVLGGFVMGAVENLFRGLQLDQDAGEALRQGVVNLARHPVPFFGDSGLAGLLGKTRELKGESGLLREALGKL